MSTMTISARVSAQRPQSRTCTDESRPIRLTRRGRLAVAAAGLLIGLSIVGAAAPQAVSLVHHDRPAVERVTVRPGETLWAIAERTAPGTDPRDTVARIESLNGLHSSAVPAGSVLLVPTAR